MVQVTLLYREADPYCHQVQEALEHLRMEESFHHVKVTLVDVKDEHSDYPALPVILKDNQVVYEPIPGETYRECKEKLRKVLCCE